MNRRKSSPHFFNLIGMAGIALAVLCLLMTTFAEDKAQKEEQRVTESHSSGD